jgi:hypothetical protein
LKTLLQLALAATIVAATFFAIQRVAEEKANALAGGGTFALDPSRPEEWRAFSLLVGQLREWGEGGLADALVRLQEDGDLRVAPGLAPGRSAVYVSALGLVARVFVRQEELVPRGLPFPDLDAPEEAQTLFGTIRLAGTLYHELQHYEGLESEPATYEREIDWYLGLREAMIDGLEGDKRRWFEWAVDSAIETAVAAREKAVEREAMGSER